MREAIVCYPMRGSGNDTEILLGKRPPDLLFFPNIWNGPGGKIDTGETILDCTVREPWEEVRIKVDPSSATLVASVDSYHPNNEGDYTCEWRVHHLTARKWRGEPRPVEGFSEVRWFKIRDLPWAEMMKDHISWLPLILHHKHDTRPLLSARFYYGNKELTVIDKCELEFTEMPKDIFTRRR